MPEGSITANGESEEFHIQNGPTKIALTGNFDGATVNFEINIDGEWKPLLDGATPINYTAGDMSAYNLFTTDRIRFNTNGGGGNMDIGFSVSYN